MKFKLNHLLGWIFLYLIYNEPLQNMVQLKSVSAYFTKLFESNHGLGITISAIVVQILAGILAYTILYFTVPKKKYILAFIGFMTMFVFLSLIRYSIEEVLFLKIFGSGNYYGDYSIFYYWLDNSYFTSNYALIGVVFFFFQYAKFNEQKKNELISEGNKTELSFLKSQLNPHFLFNNLNNLYFLIYQKSENALSYTEKLSNLLRFSLYESNEKIPLSKEKSYLIDFIDLEKMKSEKPLSLQIDWKENLENIQIHPYIFIPFVENAFKHGELYDSKTPISIQFIKSGKDLIFKIKNAFKEKQKDMTGGIGLQNVKKRLDLIYGNQHSLEILNNNEVYSVELKIKDVC